MSVVFEGLDELVAAGVAAVHDLLEDEGRVTLDAARAGIDEAKANHPYTDRTHHLTDDAAAEPDVTSDTHKPGAIMFWPAPYAGYVDEGTTRSRPYPFTPQAEESAALALEYGTESVIDAFAAKLNG